MTSPKVPRSWVEASGPLRCQGFRGLGLGLWSLIFRVGFRVLDVLQIPRAIMMTLTFALKSTNTSGFALFRILRGMEEMLIQYIS